MNYKLSNYNYFKIVDNSTVLCINLIKKIIFALDIEKYELLIKNKDSINLIECENETFFNALFKLGIIVNDSYNELEFILTEHRKEIYNDKSYRLTIIPTLECNYNCWYCYEEHVVGIMSETIKKSIINHINSIIKQENYKVIHIDWFGGEPLLYFNKLLYPLSKKIKNIVEKNNLIFTNSITTNGSLIENSMIPKLNEIKLLNYQITLDGNEKSHNKTKNNINIINSYKKTIENILNIIDNIKDSKIMLRINYTKACLDGLKDIVDDIPKKYRNKLEVVLQQVWQTYNTISKENEVNADDYKQYFGECGFQTSLYKLEEKFYRCYADKTNQCVINYNGDVFKCTARDFATHPPEGKLQQNGDINWEGSYYKRLSKTTLENERCLNCNLLPACWGPCSQKIIETDFKDFNNICNIKGIETTIDILLMEFYNKKIKSKSN